MLRLFIRCVRVCVRVCLMGANVGPLYQMREQVLEYFTNTVTEGYTSVMQASPALVAATSENDAINDKTEVTSTTCSV